MLHHGWHVTPFPTLLLTTTGRHSGDPHESPLWFIRAGEDFVVIATNYGRKEPDWSHNLRAKPLCRFTEGKRVHQAVAARAGGDDRDELIDRLVDLFPPFREYLHHADREVPVWRLRPS
jgi:deazaflavin-dependent oxidoreductase (nitroreductase family)